MLRWKLGHNPYDKSAVAARTAGGQRRRATWRIPRAPDSITWVGHSTFAVQDGGEVFLTDPHWGPRALLPRRRSPPGIPLAAVPSHAFAVLSHNHYDHLDAWSRGAAAAGRRLVRAARSRRLAARGTATSPRRCRSSTGGKPSGAAAGPSPACRHSTGRTGSAVRRNSTLWCSWLLDSGRRRYYFAGDSGYFPGFAEIGRRFGPIDVAFLPIGAYEPRWFMAYPHMNPAEAHRAFLDLGARWMVPMHWGTFDLTDEPIDLPPRVLGRGRRRCPAATPHGCACWRSASAGSRRKPPPGLC